MARRNGMPLLAIDPARSCGFALGLLPDYILCSGSWDLGPVARRRGGEFGRQLMLQFMLAQFYFDIRLEHLAIEGVANGRMHSGSLSHGKLLGVAEAVAMAFDLAYHEYSPTAIKKHATGRGNATKDDMVEAAAKTLKHKPTNHDEADAVCLWWLAASDIMKARSHEH